MNSFYPCKVTHCLMVRLKCKVKFYTLPPLVKLNAKIQLFVFSYNGFNICYMFFKFLRILGNILFQGKNNLNSLVTSMNPLKTNN